MGRGPVTAIFIVDGLHLELLSYLLVSSLRRHHPDRQHLRIKAYLSPQSADALLEETIALYAACGVETAALPDSEGVWKKSYPHGNKILACAACEDPDVVFLDTDIVCVAPFAHDVLLDSKTVGVVPEGVPTWGKQEDHWPRAYDHFDMNVPPERVTLRRGRRISFPPYFNAGVVAFRNDPDESGRRFGALWKDTAIDFDWNCAIAKKRPWLDQITLPLTLYRFGYGYQVLPDSLNFSISNRLSHELGPGNKLLHYHRVRFLAAAPQYQTILSDLQGFFAPDSWAKAEAVLRAEGVLLDEVPPEA
jgi:hypothetical protein